MLWFSVIAILLGSCLAESELVLSNPSDESIVLAQNSQDKIILPSENLNTLANEVVVQPENVESAVIPTIPEVQEPEPIPQEIAEQATSETYENPVKPLPSPPVESVLLQDNGQKQTDVTNLPESNIPQNLEPATVSTGTPSDATEAERLEPEVTENKDPNSICLKRNSYYKVDGSCDAYVECREFIAEEQLCPDGLHYNPESKWPEYPCGYPMEVSCQGRGTPQKSNPTENCPHQYGFYPPLVVDANNCSPYRMCVGGKSIDMECPSGLAFNPDTSRCDWPENVESCNSEVFLGFKCPPHPVNSRGEPLDIVINYKYDKDCHRFFSCHGDATARLLSCDRGFVFDAAVGRCADSDLVPCHSDQPVKESTAP